jgi:hypothetical protein
MVYIYKGIDQLAYRRWRYYMHLATKASSIASMDYWLRVAKSYSIK